MKVREKRARAGENFFPPLKDAWECFVNGLVTQKMSKTNIENQKHAAKNVKQREIIDCVEAMYT